MKENGGDDKMPNQDERRAKKIVEENANGLYAQIGKENFAQIWQEYLDSEDHKKIKNATPYAIAVDFAIWLHDLVTGKKVESKTL